MPRLSRLTKLGFAFYVVLALAFALGLLVGGGTGDTIEAVVAAIFALTLFAAFGGGLPIGGRPGRRYGPSIEDEEERERRRQE